MVINMIRIAFTVLIIFRVIVKVVILKVLPQIQRNDDRNWIYSSPPEVISDAILFVYPFGGALAKNAGACHTRWC